MSEALSAEFAPRVLAWQRQHGRHDLPWQNTRDPYRVWLSEIMLQQTQVATVLAYYARFLERFPDVLALAAAPLDEVLALWAGLGYYSRARNLHACARAVAALPGGRFPGSANELQSLPGIGRSTAAAIAAFCYGEPVAILDGNVKRVLTRVTGFDEDIASAAVERRLWALAQSLVPEQDAGRYAQGLMDLGATLCTPRRPDCSRCALQSLCVGHREGEPTRYPVKSRKLKRGRRESWWLWVEREGAVLLTQRPSTGVWAGLWTLPMFDSGESALDAARALGVQADELEARPSLAHALTHFDWTLHTARARVLPGQVPLPGAEWVLREGLASYALPAPLKKLLTEET